MWKKHRDLQTVYCWWCTGQENTTHTVQATHWLNDKNDEKQCVVRSQHNTSERDNNKKIWIADKHVATSLLRDSPFTSNVMGQTKYVISHSYESTSLTLAGHRSHHQNCKYTLHTTCTSTHTLHTYVRSSSQSTSQPASQPTASTYEYHPLFHFSPCMVAVLLLLLLSFERAQNRRKAEEILNRREKNSTHEPKRIKHMK